MQTEVILRDFEEEKQPQNVVKMTSCVAGNRVIRTYSVTRSSLLSQSPKMWDAVTIFALNLLHKISAKDTSKVLSNAGILKKIYVKF